MKHTLLLLLTFFTLNAMSSHQTINETQEKIKKQIGRMLVVGFNDSVIDENSQIVKDIQKYDLGGVILFDRFYNDRNRTKNITSPMQLKELTTKLKSFSNRPLLISVDQEGGKVARLKQKYGFEKIPSAFDISKMSNNQAIEIYDKQSRMLKKAGINCNFAPVVDLAVNPKNKVISGLQRSYGDIKNVTNYAQILMKSQEKEHIISVLKHFPGHGSSFGDSHKGFVDITKTWSVDELRPYIKFIKSNSIDMIMTAHVFNSRMDAKYPATLSYKTNEGILRNILSYRGVIISDDMQMKAITKHYSLKESVTLAINAGVDILLFGNQLGEQSVEELVETIYSQVKSGAIKYERILESNERIENLHTKNSIVQMPVDFGEKRIALTKEYIKEHYGLEVEDITIKPKSIVLHWTAIMKLKWCMNAMKKEIITSKRKNIAKASQLNVSAHFLVQRDGTINQLLPDNWMARHVIGLNYSAIGVENIGGDGNKAEDLTQAQVEANIKLIKYLKQKYPDIEYLLGHYEYLDMQKTPLWLELDDGYRTFKVDPGEKFMGEVRSKLHHLRLKTP